MILFISSFLNIMENLMALSASFGVIMLIISLLNLIGGWKMFAKAGKGGWEILIPIYSLYVMADIAKKKKLGILIIIFSLLSLIIPFYFSNIEKLVTVVTPLLAFLSFIFTLIISVSFVRQYNKNIWVTIGFILFPFIFIPILGLNKNVKYIGNNKIATAVTS